MFSKILMTILTAVFAISANAAGPSQIWRMEITASNDNIVEIAELELATVASGANVTDLTRSIVHTETVGSLSWVITHNLGIQTNKTEITVDAVDALLDPITSTGITIVDENTVQVDFAAAATGTAAIFGISFDTPAVNRPGKDVPPVNLLSKRTGAAIFDNNVATKWKSKRAPSIKRPVAIQYTYWVGDPTRYPNVVEYRVTASNAETAPQSWKIFYKEGSEWVLFHTVAGARFKDGETKTYNP